MVDAIALDIEDWIGLIRRRRPGDSGVRLQLADISGGDRPAVAEAYLGKSRWVM
jgi:hypothetical protein